MHDGFGSVKEMSILLYTPLHMVPNYDGNDSNEQGDGQSHQLPSLEELITWHKDCY